MLPPLLKWYPGEENIPITRATKKKRMELIKPEEMIEKIELGLGSDLPPKKWTHS